MNSDGDALLVSGRESFGSKAMINAETVSQSLHEDDIISQLELHKGSAKLMQRKNVMPLLW